MKKITGRLTQGKVEGRVFFVKKFAIPGKVREFITFPSKKRAATLAGSANGRGRNVPFPTGYRLARMLRPQTVTMDADFTSMMFWGRLISATLRRPANRSRDRSQVPGFFVLFSCVKIFTIRWVPIVARSGAERKDQYAELCDPGQM